MSGDGVSVIIPALNAAPYIANTLQSVLAQTRPALEILVTDGGSTDGTEAIVQSFGSPVRLLQQRESGRKGIGAGRNMGVFAATGRWLAFLDADDWWDPRKLEFQLAALEQAPDALLSYTASWRMYVSSGECTLSPAADERTLWPSLRWINQIVTSTVVACRETVVGLGGFCEDLKACEDWELWVRMRMRSRFVAVNEPLVYYRILSDSTSRNLENHLYSLRQLEQGSMLSGLRGRERWLVRRRLWAAQLYGGALVAREIGGREERSLLLRSVAWCPSPRFIPKRYGALLRAIIGPSAWTRVRTLIRSLTVAVL